MIRGQYRQWQMSVIVFALLAGTAGCSKHKADSSLESEQSKVTKVTQQNDQAATNTSNVDSMLDDNGGSNKAGAANSASQTTSAQSSESAEVVSADQKPTKAVEDSIIDSVDSNSAASRANAEQVRINALKANEDENKHIKQIL